MKIKRALYGYSTTKKGRKIYKSYSEGLVKELNGFFIGGAVLIPLDKARIIEGIFDSRKVTFKRYDMLKALI